MQNHIFSPLLSLLSGRHHVHDVGVVVIRVGICVVVARRVDVCLVQVVVVVVDVVVNIHHQGDHCSHEVYKVKSIRTAKDACKESTSRI